MSLPVADGPECPKCGCRDAETFGAVVRWGFEGTAAVCRHCGHQWTDEQVTPQPFDQAAMEALGQNQSSPVSSGGSYARTQCPDCGSTKTLVQSTRRPPRNASFRVTIRYHKCRRCGHTFKTAEPLE
jgi:uncharacterized Zn finger protein